MLRSFRLNSNLLIALSLVFFITIPLGCHAQSGNDADVSSGTEKTVEFDAARAYGYVKKLVEFGPHPSGSEAIKKAQDYLENELKSFGLQVSTDSFNGETPRGAIAMKNIIGELRGEKKDIVMITGHYDTKLKSGFVGANDGGSSAAAVLETARVLSKTKPEYTLWFVLFDGEAAVVDW